MTRELSREGRLAAGWVECWGFYDWEEREWKRDRGWGSTKLHGQIKRWPTRLQATDSEETKLWRVGDNVGVRPFWYRKKPKAPAPLKVGDNVIARGEVFAVHYDTPLPQVQIAFGPSFTWVDVSLIEGVKP